jgi:hypothetical protein
MRSAGLLSARVILDRLDLTPAELESRTGWSLKPEGLCKGDRCVPFPGGLAAEGVDVRAVAERLGMPVVHDEGHGLYALGPESGGHVLASAALPPITLADIDGNWFDLGSLRGKKVVIAAWASW